MIPTKNDNEVISTLKGEEVKFTFDEDSIPFLMDLLSEGLYSDPEMAVIREYSTNALDSHIESGNSAPIEVTLPSTTVLSDHALRIRDYGVGLDADDIREMYSKYGASSKRDSNDGIGMFGLGSKSAMAYCSQFTIVGIKNGIRTMVSVSKDDEGGGSLTIVDESPTDEHSGVEIVIPAKQYNNFADKARNLFRFWQAGTVLVNGREPDRFVSKINISPDIDIIDGSTSYVVMGNVPYPVSFTDYNLGLPYSTSIVVRVPVGTVRPTPSREALKLNKETKATLAAAAESFQRNRKDAIEKMIASSSGPLEAIRKLAELRKTLGNFKLEGGLVFKGKVIPETLTFDDAVVAPAKHQWGTKLNEHSRVKQVTMDSLPDTVFVQNWDQGKFTPTTKKKMIKWLDESGLASDNIRHFVFVRDGFKSDIIPSERIIDWAVLKAIKIEYEKVAQNGQKTIGVYNMFMWDGTDGSWVEQPAEDIPIDRPIFYVIYSKDRNWTTEVEILKSGLDEFTFVELYQNREAKFLRTFPAAARPFNECTRIAKEWGEKVAQDDLEAYAVQDSYEAGRIRKFMDHKAEILDPRIVHAMNLMDRDLTKFKKRASIYGRYGVTISQEEHDEVFRDYPLLNGYQSASVTHKIEYINAIYKARSVIDHCDAW